MLTFRLPIYKRSHLRSVHKKCAVFNSVGTSDILVKGSSPSSQPGRDLNSWSHFPKNQIVASLKLSTLRVEGAISVTMTAVCFVWLEPLMSKLVGTNSEIPGLTTADTSWLVASIEIGEVVATIPAGLLADRYGRKPIILSTGPMCLLGWVLVLTTRNIAMLYFVRLIQGVAVAVVYTVVPMYIAEISEPRIRGELSGHFMTLWYAGVLYSYIIGPLADYQTYTFLCAIIPAIFIASFIFMPESPYYLCIVNQPERAKKALQWLRKSKDVEEEFKSISLSVENDMKNQGSWKDLVATKKDRKAFFIVQLVCSIKYLNGIPAIISYATETFKRGTTINPHAMTISLGVILMLSCVGSALVSDSIGRRPLLLVSILGSVFFNSLVAAYYFLAEQTSVDVSDYYWIMFLSLGGFCIMANVGLGPLLQTMQAEYFPSNTRGIGGGVTEMTASITTFINLKSYQMLADAFGIYMNYVTYVFFGAVGFIVMYYTVPETAGRSLGEIQNDLSKQVQPKDIRNGVSNVGFDPEKCDSAKF